MDAAAPCASLHVRIRASVQVRICQRPHNLMAFTSLATKVHLLHHRGVEELPSGPSAHLEDKVSMPCPAPESLTLFKPCSEDQVMTIPLGFDGHRYSSSILQMFSVSPLHPLEERDGKMRQRHSKDQSLS